ncbi:saposin-related [Anaeramoeba flamelloides]|uniref:Saposin-related n=1 Tax=Anaeramoeba flamelloides TaxID=1746091 RepID=A0ABQ8XXC7_9EUKA|nr:saposin-related [Anaeramoeba flamelloides]
MKLQLFVLISLIFLTLAFATEEKEPANGIECTACEAIMSFVEKWLAEDKTLGEIETLLEKVCPLLPSSFESLCDSIIEQYVPQIIQFLEQEEPPAKICGLIGLCSAEEEEPQGMYCTICEAVMSFVEKWLAEGKTLGEIETLLEKVCAYLPGNYQSLCDSIIEQYVPAIIQYLEQEIPPAKICGLIGLCTAEEEEPANGIECTVCEAIMSFVEKWLAEEKTLEEIEELLEKVCPLLPSSFESLCDSIIEQYVPQIIQFLEQEEPPAKICGLIRLCSAEEEEPQGMPCTICEAVMSFVEKWLAEGKTLGEIETLLEKVCALLPDSYQSLCDSIIEQYVPVIIQYLEQEIPPAKICGLIGLCTAEEEEQANPIYCTLCEAVMSFVEKWLDEEKTLEEIEKLLENVCTLIPEYLTNICDSVIEQYIPLIIESLEQDFPPAEICGLIGLCSAEEEEPQGIECTICEYVVGFVEKWLAEDKTENEIEKGLEKICKLLPGSYKSVCENIVDQYLPLIIGYLEQDLPPSKICGLIGVCSSEEEEPANGMYCTICEAVMSFVEKWLADGKTLGEIETLLEKVCTFLPNSYQSLCDSIIEQYIPVIIQYLEQEIPPAKICGLIGLCSAEAEEPQDIKCTACTTVVGFVEKFLAEGNTEQEIIKLLEDVCQFLPNSYKSICDSIIEQYLPAIIQYIEQELPAQKICELIGLCSAEAEEPQDIKCTACTTVVGFVEKFLAEGNTEQEIIKLLEDVCQFLPNSYKSICDSIIEQYLPAIIQYIEQELPAQKICELIGLCSAEEEEPQDMRCTICTSVASFVEKFVAEEKTEDFIEKEIEKACALLPGNTEQICDGIVEQYLPAIIEYLEQEEPPKKVCELIGLC